MRNVKWLSLASLLSISASCACIEAGAGGGSVYLTDDIQPFAYPTQDDVAPVAKVALSLGDGFLVNGNLKPGYRTVTGAVWQPRFWLYGTGRTALQTYRTNGGPQRVEWANRLDLYGNLQLTGTERIVIGVSPTHDKRGFSGTRWTGGDEETLNGWNMDISTLYFEGDLAEVFPGFDPLDTKGMDIGFSLGRQELNFQDGIMVNDTMDVIGLTKNSLRPAFLPAIVNWRITALYAWNEVNRHDSATGNVEDKDSELFGLFQAIDTRSGTHEFDLAYVDGGASKDDLLTWGVSTIRRIYGIHNISLRYNGSRSTDVDSTVANDGHLFFGEYSWTPHGTVDVTYLNAFYGHKQYRSPARGELAGGPLGRTGLLFAARGIGSYPFALSNQASEAHGMALGRQFIFNGGKQHVILEGGFRASHDSNSTSDFGTGAAAQWQRAFWHRYLLQIDGFWSREDERRSSTGARLEWRIKI
jgi:hypothetical protein